MKARYLYGVILIFCGWLSIRSVSGHSASTKYGTIKNNDPDHLQQGIYLVIGVFTYADNADSFSRYAQTQGFSAKYAYYPIRGYYYVYTFTSDSALQVIDRCLQIRSTSEFEDAWVFRAYEADGISETSNWGNAAWDTLSVNTPVEEPHEMAVIETIKHQTPAQELFALPVAKHPKKEKAEPGYDVFFRTLGEGDQEVRAVVQVVDGAHAKSIKQCQANEPEVLEHARLLTKQVQLITYAIGYRKATFDLALDHPVNDSTASYVSVDDEMISVKMPLEKLKQGDVQVMFNTYFYGNASVMREKSRYELEELLQFLRESPTTTIKLHGHTNGSSRGVTYLYLKDHGNFFDIRRSGEYIKRGVGAKKLSEMRAETIRQYLVKQGIEESRIETKGWGGKHMLYDADSPLAKNNIRVEIEVLSE